MYHIKITKKAERTLRKLPQNIGQRINSKIALLRDNPYAKNNNVKALQGREGYRLRVGDYRVIYNIYDNILVIEVVEIGHRKEIYQ